MKVFPGVLLVDLVVSQLIFSAMGKVTIKKDAVINQRKRKNDDEPTNNATIASQYFNIQLKIRPRSRRRTSGN